ncbi:hypothetical protein KFK09_025982 [Dendrobium nobile]|uniref:Uncharacterized protein n=1 Tax=Dendrobium nobile TaxID=94219 RepID=A0A8T3A7D2_DENNO|nr:hypothetical protein KFK09_025982 [Dendrobium nobile]
MFRIRISIERTSLPSFGKFQENLVEEMAENPRFTYSRRTPGGRFIFFCSLLVVLPIIFGWLILACLD